MNPLQLIAFMVASDRMREHALSALPDAPQIPHVPAPSRAPVVRARLAGALRRTADRVDPRLEPSAC